MKKIQKNIKKKGIKGRRVCGIVQTPLIVFTRK